MINPQIFPPNLRVCVEDKEFLVHKEVLSQFCRYISAMLRSGMVETSNNVLDLKAISLKGFQTLLDLMYQSKVLLHLDFINEVLFAADYLQVDVLLKECINYMEASINYANCVKIWQTARRFKLRHTARIALGFILDNMSKLDSDIFYILSAEEMHILLSIKYPMDCLEVDVLDKVVQWLCVKSKDNENQLEIYAHLLLECIQFSAIDPQQLKLILKRHLSYGSTELCKHPIYYVINEIKILRQPLIDLNLINAPFNIRGMKQAMIKPSKYGLEIKYLFFNELTWKPLTFLPQVFAILDFSVKVVNNELYVLSASDLYKYQPRLQKWFTLRKRPFPYCEHSSISLLNNCLYVVGGNKVNPADLLEDGVDDSQDINLAVKNCVRYDILQNRWFTIFSLPQARTCHASVVHKIKDKSFIFVSGGQDEELVRTEMFKYDPEKNSWELCTYLSKPRESHTMISYEGKIYVFGGSYSMITDDEFLHYTIEAYNPVSNIWEVVTRHMGSFMVKLGKKVWFSGETSVLPMNGPFACFDLSTKKWSEINKGDWEKYFWEVDNWKYNFEEHNSVSMYIPESTIKCHCRLTKFCKN